MGQILANITNIEEWRTEKSGIWPEPRLMPDEPKNSSECSIYADDNSVGGKAETVEELKGKTETVLHKVFKHMKSSRLLVNPDVMLMASYQKRTKNNLEFKVEVEGMTIKEVSNAHLLGVEISNNFSWDAQVNETVEKCSTRLNGLYKINREVGREEKKKLAEGIIVSKLRYAIEVTSSGSESSLNRLQSMQSKTARFILGTPRKEWSRSQGFEELGWLSMAQIAVESSLRMLFKVLKTKRPEKLYFSIFNEEKGQMQELTTKDLEKRTKLSRKSWRVRVIRYGKILPDHLYDLDPNSSCFKTSLKSWIKSNIPVDGGSIVKGKVDTKDRTD